MPKNLSNNSPFDTAGSIKDNTKCVSHTLPGPSPLKKKCSKSIKENTERDLSEPVLHAAQRNTLKDPMKSIQQSFKI